MDCLSKRGGMVVLIIVYSTLPASLAAPPNKSCGKEKYDMSNCYNSAGAALSSR